jgi:hypothetical protein
LYDGFMRDKTPPPWWATLLPASWITALGHCLQSHNPFRQSLSHLNYLNDRYFSTAHLTLQDRGSTSEIATVMNYVNIASSQVNSCNIIIVWHDGDNQKIPTISHLWEPLAYPLFFPHGTLSWGVTGNVAEIESGEHD